jgi:hypothetical protein
MGGITYTGAQDYVADQRITMESERRISLRDNRLLIVHEHGEEFTIRIAASKTQVQVGCTRIDREAWDEIVRQVEDRTR